MNLRITWSSTRRSAKSCLLAYQRLDQSTMMPVRNPVGRTFWPMLFLPKQIDPHLSMGLVTPQHSGGQTPLGLVLLGCLFQVGQGNVNVRHASLDGVCRARSPGHDALSHRAPIYTR